MAFIALRHNLKESRRPLLWALAVLCVGVILTLVAARVFVSYEQDLRHAKFDELIAEELLAIDKRFLAFDYGLRGLRSLMIAVETDTLDQAALSRIFKGRDLQAEFHGALGVGIVYRVSPESVPTFTDRMRQTVPSYQVRQFTPHDADRWPIAHIYPLHGNEAALGLDIASEANRSRALKYAVEKNEMALTEPITLVQEKSKINHGFLLMLPLYEEISLSASEEDRRRTAKGVVYIPIEIDKIFQDMTGLNKEYTLSAKSIAEAIDNISFYESPIGISKNVDGLFKEVKIQHYGQEWILKFSALPDFYPNKNGINSVFYIACFMFSVFVSILIFNLIKARDRYIDELLEKSSLGVIFDSAQDAMIRVDDAACITALNKSALELFDISSAEALGANVSFLLKSVFSKNDVLKILEDIDSGDAIAARVVAKELAYGDFQYLAVSAFPIEETKDKKHGYALSFRDYTARINAENEVKSLNQNLEIQVEQRTADLEQSRRDLQVIFDAAPSLIGYWDANQINRFSNKTYIKWFNKSPDNIVGGHLRDLLGEELYELNRPYISKVLTGEQQTFERVIKHVNGEDRYTLTHYLPDIVNNEVIGFYAIVHDVSELVEQRKKLTNLISENEVLLGTINQHLLYSVAGLDGRIIDANESFSKLSGFSKQELMGSNHRIVNSGYHPKSFWLEMWETVTAGKSWRGEVCNRSKSGEIYWVDTVVAPHLNAEGKIERFVSLRSDITHRKLVEKEYRRLTQLLHTVLSAATELSIIATDTHGVIKLFNAGAERMLGYSADDIINKQTPALFHKPVEVFARAQELSDSYGVNIEGFSTFTVEPEKYGKETREWTYIAKNGSEVPVSLTVTIIRSDSGDAIGYLGVAYDISQRIRHESDLLSAKLIAEKANIAKSEFLANMSHEIRTPMNGILGMTYLLKRQGLPAESKNMIDKIISSGDLLLRIINDILDYSKIESNAIELNIEHFDLKFEIDRVFAMISGAIYDKPVSLLLSDFPENMPILLGDSLRFGQVLINILGNAAKFTREGEIAVSVNILERDDLSNRLLLEIIIRDTGIGISKDKLDMIFEPFMQEDSSTSKRFGGTGLGLAITAKIIKLMGGSIYVDSEVNKGSIFTIILPFVVDPNLKSLQLEDVKTIVQPKGQHRLQDISIFVVDDSEINREVACSILKIEGAIVTLADDGVSALELLAAKPKVDVILMDIQMPTMDGYEATRRLKQIPEYQHTPVIALTAGVLLTHRDKALAAGMCDFVGKPFNVDKLVEVILSKVSLTLVDDAAVEVADADILALEQAMAQFKRQFIEQSLPTHSALFKEILSLKNANDQRDVITAALHKLAGEAGMVGLGEIGDYARQLENDVGSDEFRIDDIYRRLEHLLSLISHELDVV